MPVCRFASRAFALSFVLVAVLLSAFARAAEPSPLFDVPRLDAIAIDGNPADWGDRGFRVDVMAPADGPMRPAADLAAAFRLGWDERGLLVLVTVHDNVADEADDDESLWQADGIEMFVAAAHGAGDHWQAIVAPGCDARHPQLRQQLFDQRVDAGLKASKLTMTAARTKIDGGYVLEALLPWQNLGIKPADGIEAAFQIYVNDSDGPGSRYQALWYPRAGAHGDSTLLHRIRLAKAPSPAVRMAASAQYERFRRTRVSVTAAADLAGKAVELRDGERAMGTGKLAPDASLASASIVLPMPAPGKPYGPLSVLIDGQPAAMLAMPDADEQRSKELLRARIRCHPLFTGLKLPDVDFESPSLAEDLIGQYTIKTTFYDAQYNAVTAASKPGRYGAVIEIRAENGRIYRRFRSLLCMSGRLEWWDSPAKATYELPKELGIDPAIAADNAMHIGNLLRDLFLERIDTESVAGMLLAGMADAKPLGRAASVYEDALALDRQWWVGLKRKLYGNDKTFASPVAAPRKIEGKPATLLHDGTMKEAGMKEDAPAKIDALLKTWSENTDQAFAVCVARHGTIVLHKAYGTRDGKPMTVDTKSYMASITKAMSGTCMMMLVDQGLVDLDDRMDKFLPPFRGLNNATPMTVRHLFTHTNGLWDHWGDHDNDFEEMIAGYYPHLRIGVQHSYNGAGLSLGGKIIEAVSGEALPLFYKKHLFEPLGCRNTDVTTTSYDARSTPMDIARLGQLLLNKGAYGEWRFMSEQTFAQMTPRKLTKVLGPDTTVEWGIGLTWMDDAKTVIGHGAASSATLHVDPAKDLVIVMTRNTAGKNFAEYHPKFLAAVRENMAE